MMKRLVRKKARQMTVGSTKLTSSVSGLTLIECLVAIAVIGITSAAVGPMMVFSVATRIQNQKSEQALQIAQAEIDKVRLVIELGGDYEGDLAAIPLHSAATTTIARNVPAPTAFISSAGTVATVTDARTVDLDGDNDDDFAIQLFRTAGILSGSTPVAFDVGVRVYDVKRAEANLGSLGTDTVGLTFTSGEGDRGSRPLAALYSQIAQGDRDASLCQQWKYLSTTRTVPSSLICPSP